jgi:hypothetical protein
VGNWYNFMRNAEVAQQVEQRTENPRVNGPIPFLGTFSSGSSSVVECLLAKEEVASSNLVFRSIFVFGPKWRNRQTRWSQKPLGGNPRVGSTPTFGSAGLMPSCVVVAQRTLNPFAKVRILARQPYHSKSQLTLLALSHLTLLSPFAAHRFSIALL